MEEAIAEWFAEQNNMASVPAVAEFLGVDVNYVRDWARDNDLPRVGVAFVFSAEHALEMWAELEDDEEPFDQDDDEFDDEDDEFVCTSCDSPVDSDAAYCSSCGAELDDEDDDEDDEAA